MAFYTPFSEGEPVIPSTFNERFDEIGAAFNARAFDVKNYGAVGDGVADDRAAIRLALDAVEAASGGTLYFPAGTFNVTRINSATAYCLVLPSNITIQGAGRGVTTIKLADNQSNFTRVFRILSQENVTIRGLTIDGNCANQPLSTDQMHGIYLDGASNVLVEDVELAETAGDGIYVGYPTAISENIRVINCNFRGNERSGISLIGAGNVLIQGCHFADDIEASPIDAEPSGSPGANNTITNIRIIGNHIENNSQFSITCAGADHVTPSVGWVITDNIIGGPCYFSDSSKGVFANNIMVVTSSQTQALEFGYNTEDWLIEGNYIETAASGYGIYAYFVTPYYTKRLKIVNNTIIAANSPIRLEGVEDVEVRNNRLKLLTVTTSACLLITATRSMTNIKVEGNTLVNGLDHITVTRTSTNTITGLVVRGNTYGPDASNPATLRYNLNLIPTGAAWLPGLTLGADNIITAGGTGTYLLPSGIGSFSLGGLAAGGSMILSGWGDPEGVVSAATCSTYLRRDGGTGSTFYVKESGTTSSGWVAK